MHGPAGAFTLVVIETLLGTFVVMFGVMAVFRVVDRGYYRSTSWVLAPLQIATSFALPAGLRPLGLAAGAGIVLFLIAVYTQRPLLEWITGALASAAAAATIITAGTHGCATSCVVAGAHAGAGALLLGTVTQGMVLGHWYLNQPRLPIAPLKGSTLAFLAALVISLVTGAATRPTLMKARVPASILAASPSSFWWVWLFLLSGTALLALMTRSTVWAVSTQSATGLYYIAIITAIAAQFVLNLLVVSLKT
jgi:hypothetical protein